jgi:uncharacterized RDD family membrane protein YckC
VNEDRTDVLGRRIGAALLDFLVLALVFVVVGLIGGDTSSGEGNASVTLGGAATVAFALISLLYYGLSEALTGQTLGKKALGVRVARLDGSKAGAGAVVIRTLLRIVDSLPLAYLVGLIVVLVTGRRRQRLGDLAAGTTVVSAR